jgi:hypothetical protein
MKNDFEICFNISENIPIRLHLYRPESSSGLASSTSLLYSRSNSGTSPVLGLLLVAHGLAMDRRGLKIVAEKLFENYYKSTGKQIPDKQISGSDGQGLGLARARSIPQRGFPFPPSFFGGGSTVAPNLPYSDFVTDQQEKFLDPLFFEHHREFWFRHRNFSEIKVRGAGLCGKILIFYTLSNF